MLSKNKRVRWLYTKQDINVRIGLRNTILIMETEEVENNGWEERPEQHCEQGELLADHNSRDDEGNKGDRYEGNMSCCQV